MGTRLLGRRFVVRRLAIRAVRLRRAAAGEPLGVPRSGPLPIMPVVLSRIPELVAMPLLLLVMPPLLKVVLLPLAPAREVGWLWPACCAMAAVPNRATRATARESFFIASSVQCCEELRQARH